MPFAEDQKILEQAAQRTVTVPLRPTKAMVEAMREIEEANGGFSIENAWAHIINAASGLPGMYGDHKSDKPEVIDGCTCKICCIHRASARRKT